MRRTKNGRHSASRPHNPFLSEYAFVVRVVTVGSYDRNFNRNILNARLLAQVDYVKHIDRPSMALKANRMELWNHHKAAAGLRLIPSSFGLFLRTLSDSVRNPGTTYFVQYPGYLDVPMVRLAASIRAGKVLYDPFISLYDTIVHDRRLRSDRSWLARAVKAMDVLALRSADRVICDTPQTGDYLAKLSGSLREKFSTLWVGADEQTYFPPDPGDAHRARSELLSELGLESDDCAFLVLYYGNYIPLHGIDRIVRAAAFTDSRVKFVFVGDGQTLVSTQQLVSEMALTNITFLDRRSPERIRDLIWGSDLILGVFGSSDKARRVLPNKLMEAMACRQAVLTARTPATDSFLATVPTTDNSPDAIAEAINSLAEADSLHDLRAQVHQEYQEKFSEAVRLSQLEQVLIETANVEAAPDS